MGSVVVGSSSRDIDIRLEVCLDRPDLAVLILLKLPLLLLSPSEGAKEMACETYLSLSRVGRAGPDDDS